MTWPEHNSSLNISDPGRNLMYQAHQYFGDHSAGWDDRKGLYDATSAYPDIGVDRIRPFVEWCKQPGVRCFVGEYGVHDDDPRWLVVLDRFLAYLDAEGIGATYWAGGPWWGLYMLSVEPHDGVDRPQTSILTRHLGTVR